MIERYVTAASTYAKDIDNLIILIGVLVGVWWVLSSVVFLGFIWKFRAKDGRKAEYITGEEKHQKRWVTIPHLLVLVCDVFIIIGAVQVWVKVKQELPPAERTVRIISQQWSWSFIHPGPDGKFDTADDIGTGDELHTEVDKVYHGKLLARDVMHSFSVPVFRLKQDSIPGREITVWWKATKTGTYDIQCTEMCGVGHGIMAARIVIETPEQHAAWLASRSGAQYATLEDGR